MAAPTNLQASSASALTVSPSMHNRLSESGINESTFVWDFVQHLATRHLCLNSAEDTALLNFHAQTHKGSLWVKHGADLSTIGNGKVRVGISEIESESGLMLGLFASESISKGNWITSYGGIQEWPTERRTQSKNTHSRRVPESSWIWNGRPWALLFSKTSVGYGGSHLNVTCLTVLNLLLQLEHESWHKGEAGILKQPLHNGNSESTDTSIETEIEFTPHPVNCRKCAPRSEKPNICLPRCGCCGIELGLFLCEVADLVCAWPLADQKALNSFIKEVRQQIEGGGVGYMANSAACKSDLNAQCIAVSPYSFAIASIQPMQLIYKAIRDIAVGEEILVAYNNNESRAF